MSKDVEIGNHARRLVSHFGRENQTGPEHYHEGDYRTLPYQILVRAFGSASSILVVKFPTGFLFFPNSFTAVSLLSKLC